MSLFAKMLSDIRHSSGVAGDSLSLQVTNLVDNVWEEASGELRQVLSVPIESLKAEKVDKAEGALLSIRRMLDESNSPSKESLENLSEEFYSSLPHKPEWKKTIKKANTVA